LAAFAHPHVNSVICSSPTIIIAGGQGSILEEEGVPWPPTVHVRPAEKCAAGDGGTFSYATRTGPAPPSPPPPRKGTASDLAVLVAGAQLVHPAQ